MCAQIENICGSLLEKSENTHQIKSEKVHNYATISAVCPRTLFLPTQQN